MADGDAPVPRRRDLRRSQEATGPVALPAAAQEGQTGQVPTTTGQTGQVPTTTGQTGQVPTTTGQTVQVPTTTGSTAAVARRPLPAEHRRRWIVLTLVAVLLTVAAITGGPWLYARLTTADAAAPLSLTTQTQVPSNDPNVPLTLDGTWRVATGSQAGYRIGENLNGSSVEVVGRTDEVSGTVTITGDALSAVDVVVQTAGIATDESARDTYFRRALDTTTYPQATFVASGPVDIAALSTATSPISISVPGKLTIRDQELDATADVKVQRTTDGLEALGGISVALTDLGLTAPTVPFVTVNDTGSVEFRLELTR